MSTISIKQNNIDFTLDNINTPKGYTPVPGASFVPSDVITPSTGTFNISELKTAETEGWLNDLRVLHSLFIDWDGGTITFNGTTYTIENTGQLLAAIQNAGNVATTLSDSNLPIRSSVVKQEFSDLEAAIANLANVAAENMSNLD